LLAEAATRQKNYDKVKKGQEFKVGDCVWLFILMAKKLDPQWDGRWTVKAVRSALNVEITDGKSS